MRHSRYQGLWINLRESSPLARVMRTRQGLSIAVLGALLLSLVAVIVVKPLEAKQGQSSAPLASKAIFFASDGMRPDLMEKYAAEGAMPTYANLMASGVRATTACSQAFPPNTGVGWYTLATGTWPSEHGSTNNTYHRTGEGNFNNRTSLLAGGHPTGRHARRRRRARRQEGRPDRMGRRRQAPASPVRPSTSPTSSPPAACSLRRSTRPSRRAPPRSASRTRSRRSRRPPAGRTCRPAIPPRPAQQTQLTVATSFAAQNPTRVYDVYLYDSVVNGAAAYDHAILVRSGAAKDGSQASVGPGGRRLQGDQADAARTA